MIALLRGEKIEERGRRARIVKQIESGSRLWHDGRREDGEIEIADGVLLNAEGTLLAPDFSP